MESVTTRFKDVYRMLSKDNLYLLDELYADTIDFQDPIHRIAGLEPLKDYLAKLYAGVQSCTFSFEAEVTGPGTSMMTGTMVIRHPRLNGGKAITVPGVSHIRYAERIVYHHDYFDVGRMVYEQIPILGAVVRAVKRTL